MVFSMGGGYLDRVGWVSVTAIKLSDFSSLSPWERVGVREKKGEGKFSLT